MNLAIRNILDIAAEHGVDSARSLMLAFSCSKNADVERFFRFNAVDFALQGITITYVALNPVDGALLGAFAIANRILHIPKTSVSRTMGRKLAKFSDRSGNSPDYELAAPLIAQIGKNDTSKRELTGHDLLSCALSIITAVNHMTGGRIAYLECEDVPQLTAFYEREGFRCVAERPSSLAANYHVYMRFIEAPHLN